MNNIKTYWLYPTRDCNLRCRYCYQNLIRNKTSVENKQETDATEKVSISVTDTCTAAAPLYMSEETAKAVIEFIENDEPGRKKRIQFFGGEPLLAWNIIEKFVKELNSKVSYSITTNGTLLDEERLKFLKKNQFGIAVSIDGPPGVTRKTRPGSENTPVDLIRRYYPTAQIIMTLSPHNIEDAYKSTVWFINKGFRNIAHNIAVENEWSKAAVKSHHQVFRNLSDLYIKKQLEERCHLGFLFINYARKVIRNSRYKGMRNICGSNPNLLSIDTNGDIYPCQDMVTLDINKKYRLGNVRSGYDPPGKIPLTKMKFENRSKCTYCWFYHQCVGGCGPKNLFIMGDRYTPITSGCELYSQQASEGIRALLNTGQLELSNIEREKTDDRKRRF